MAKTLDPVSLNGGHLPAGWTRVKFGDVVNDVNEAERSPLEAGLTRYVGLEHLEPRSFQIANWGSLEEDTVSFTKRFRTGQVLFGKRRAYQRKVAVADFDGICSSDILTFEPLNGRLSPKLLPFIVQSDDFFDHALNTSSGSLSPRTRWSQLKGFEFPLPPLEEQSRLADLLWASNDATQRFLHAANECDRLRRVALAHFMSGRHSSESVERTPLGRLPKSWKVVRIEDAGDVQLGRQRSPKYQSGMHSRPYLRVANVFDGYLDLSDVLEMDFQGTDFETFRLQPQDILLNEGQSRELVGRCAMFNGEIENCCFQNTLVRFRSGDELIPEFAFFYLQFAFYKGIFAAIASQTTSIAHLGAQRFARLYMPVPPRDYQETAVRVIGDIQNNRDQLRTHIEAQKQMEAGLIESVLYCKRGEACNDV